MIIEAATLGHKYCESVVGNQIINNYRDKIQLYCIRESVLN